MLFQIIIGLIILIILSRVILKYSKNEISKLELLFWLAFWVIILIIVLFPDIINYIANLVGVGRGVDVAIYIALLLIFYIIFKIYTRIDRVEKDMTKLVRKIALIEKDKKGK